MCSGQVLAAPEPRPACRTIVRAQHSQSLEALLAHIPGLTVVMPSAPADTYGLLRASIQDPNPVVFIENRLQYGIKGPKPPVDHLVPLGKPRASSAPAST